MTFPAVKLVIINYFFIVGLFMFIEVVSPTLLY